MLGILTSLAMLACTGDKTTDTSTVTDTGPVEEEGCTIEVSAEYPAVNAVDMYYQGNLVVELSDDDETATLSLVDSAGAEVAGETTVDGDVLTFDPAEFLTPSTSYTLNVSTCGGENVVEIPFTTSALGTELTDGEQAIVGQTYSLDISSGTFLEPAGVGDLIGSLLENNILIGIESVEDGQMNIRGAISVAGTPDQDFCTATLESFPSADFSAAPYFEIPSGDVELSVAGFTATIFNLSVRGTYAADASYFGGGYLEGELDARQIYPLLGDAGFEADGPQEVCDLLLGFGVSCVPCGSDNEAFCVRLVVDRLKAEATGAELGLVCESDCHESCAENDAEACAEPQALDLGECPAE